jgi:hypothetical protein
MKKFSTYLVLAVLGLASVGCSDDSDNATPNKTTLLTAKKWRITAQTTSTTVAGSTITNDVYADMEPCERDNFAQFLANKVVTFDEGATRCDQADPQSTTGSWDFNSDQTKLNLSQPDLGGAAYPFDIVTLNESTLALRYTGTVQGFAVTLNITFTSF